VSHAFIFPDLRREIDKKGEAKAIFINKEPIACSKVETENLFSEFSDKF
jgi:hypothetical protein